MIYIPCIGHLRPAIETNAKGITEALQILVALTAGAIPFKNEATYYFGKSPIIN